MRLYPAGSKQLSYMNYPIVTWPSPPHSKKLRRGPEWTKSDEARLQDQIERFRALAARDLAAARRLLGRGEVLLAACEPDPES